MNAIAVIVGHVKAAVAADREIHGATDDALAVAPAGGEVLDRRGAAVTKAHARDRIARRHQAEPGAVQGHEEITDVLGGKLRAWIEGKPERRRVWRQLDA